MIRLLSDRLRIDQIEALKERLNLADAQVLGVHYEEGHVWVSLQWEELDGTPGTAKIEVPKDILELAPPIVPGVEIERRQSRLTLRD